MTTLDHQTEDRPFFYNSPVGAVSL